MPEPNTAIRRGDQLLIVATAEAKSRAPRARVRAVSGTAGWPAGRRRREEVGPARPDRWQSNYHSASAAPRGRRPDATWEEPVPTYAYACTACDHRFDAVQSFSDDSLTAVPRVRGPAAQGVQRRRRRLQGQRLLPHRLRAAGPPPRCPRPALGRPGSSSGPASRRPASSGGSERVARVRGVQSTASASSSSSVCRRVAPPEAADLRLAGRDRGIRRHRPPVHRAGVVPAVHRRSPADACTDDRRCVGSAA